MIPRPDRRHFFAGLAGLVALPTLAFRAAAHGGVICGTIHDVEIGGFAFAPDVLEAAEGDGIRWINRDLAPHTATATDGTWDTGTLEQGKSVTLPVEAGMTGSYHCQFHPEMTASLTIRSA